MSGGFRSRARTSDQGPQGASNSERREPSRRRQAPQSQRQAAPGKITRSRGEGSSQRRGDFQRIPGVDIPRCVAVEVLLRVAQEGAYANLTLPALLRSARVKGRDAAFATELTYGTLRQQGVLDAVINDCASRLVAQMAPEVAAALRLGAYQLLYTRVDRYAAVDTSVRIVEGLGQERAKGFVNGILRTISRSSREQWLNKLTPAGEVAALAFRYAHPEWIAHSFSKVVGIGELQQALEADSQRPSVHLVARPGEITAEELALITGGEQGKYSPYAVYLEGGSPSDVEPVRQGLAGVQDEGSQIIARALATAPIDGDDQGKWLDLCAGPGGKAVLLGALARIEGATVDAVEVSPHRAQLIQKAVGDLPVVVHTADGRNPDFPAASFDRILVDAPCSGLGALRRRPEARWKKQEEDILPLQSLQQELLSSALRLVRPGGVVVYSTCSPDLRETREVLSHVLANPEFADVQELPARPLAAGMEDTGEELSVQMWPHRHGTDAMFFAVLKRSPKGTQ
ncbi:RsmB/NOP family class I SAM-dependent RNA methyltransferase [Corynebacterium kozikiae]|uniref:RsmB/NOP family class I SAM-dependent RNA methyltransferase n=1 Tax=Corynebacterium kozikiae TaxID=2968469 RepID=UPI00211CEE1B|nr:transcription antitermination factor NusB [Corynebacterium sp. 76QC2CO]MCQ9342800.1 MFS transporter [Corynebacterium sp. 76QC2CO]